MKNATTCAKRLTALLKKLDPGDPADLTQQLQSPGNSPAPDDPIAVLVLSFMMWESTTPKAIAAYNSIFQSVVDFNDLRVCMPHETVDIIGARYPRALDRCQRLRAVLRDIYCREYAVDLERLNSLGKREVKKYIESLEGIVPYVSARLMLMSFQTHAIPVDDQLRTHLIEAGAADTSAENEELASWLERQVKASDGVQTHLKLQNWVDNASAESGAGKKRRKKSTGKKTTRRAVGARTTKKKLTKA